MGGGPLWQDLAALSIVLVAALYLGRRWWPALASLLGLQPPAPSATKAACGQASGACQQCGSSGTTPQRDHRITIVRPRK